MTKYIISWRYNNKDYSISFDSMTAAELHRITLLGSGFEIKDVSISLKDG